MSRMEPVAPMRPRKGVTVERLFYGAREFGEMFGISKSKAAQIVMSGRVKSVWLDGRRLIPSEEVRAFADRLKVEAGLAPVA